MITQYQQLKTKHLDFTAHDTHLVNKMNAYIDVVFIDMEHQSMQYLRAPAAPRAPHSATARSFQLSEPLRGC